jgi:hypothetical protein
LKETVSSNDNKDARQLEFPSNILAHVIISKAGCADLLSRGLSSGDCVDLAEARRRTLDELLSGVSPGNRRVLFLAKDPGAGISALMSAGHDVTFASPDRYLIDQVRTRLKRACTLIHSPFEDLKIGRGDIDAIVMQETAGTINPLVLFDKAYDMLSGQGEVVICDDFPLHQEDGSRECILEHMLALARRCGFELLEKRDLSPMVIPFLDVLARLVEEQHTQLAEELDVPPRRLGDLVRSIRHERETMARQDRIYVLLRFGKSRQPRWRPGIPADKDQTSLLELFRTVFNEGPDPALWHWKYGDGRGKSVVARRGDRIVAHYGGITRRVSFFGEIMPFWQISDVMVDTSERGTFTRRGTFFLVASSFIEVFGSRYCGRGFGFPNRRVMTLAEKLGLYRQVDQIVEVHWMPAEKKTSRLGTRVRPLDRNRDEHLVEELWSQMHRDLKEGLVVVRDWDYLRHRYLDHPVKRYDVLLIQDRFRGRARGIVILNGDGEICELLDLVAPLHEIPVLIDEARRFVRRRGAKGLYCWITHHHAGRFSRTGGEIKPLDVFIPTNVWIDGPDVNRIRDRWWLMSGDTDFR